MSYLKAVLGAVYAGLVALEAALDDGGVTAQEGVKAGIAAILGLGLIYATPNRPVTTKSTVLQPGEPPATIVSETK